MISPTFLVLVSLLIPQVAQGMIETSDRAEPGTNCNYAKRTRFNITWNCISTIVICAWVSVHPNVPSCGYWRALRRRLKMMFWTVIAPEFTLAYAVRQWFAAKETSDTYNAVKGELGALEYRGKLTCVP